MHLRRSRFLALLAAPAVTAAPAFAQSVKLHIAAVPSDSYAEPYYALDGGFFKKAGLDVTIDSFNSGGAITTAVAGGAITLGIADPIQVGAGFERGVGFAYFAGGNIFSSEAPTTQLCVLKDGPVKAPKDLNGKTLGVFGLRSMPVFATRDWLASNGVEAENVKFVELPPSAMVPAISRGTIAAGMVVEPELSTAASDGVVPIGTPYEMVAKMFYINSWFTTRDWLSKNGDTVKKLVGAIYETARWANANRAQTLPILAKYTKMQESAISKMTRASYDTMLDPKKIQPPLTIAAKYKVLPRPLNAEELIYTV